MIDILLDIDIDFDLQIENGDFKTGESTRQHQALLLVIDKGELREFPMRGVGVQSWLLDDVQRGDLNGEIKRQFEADGMTVIGIKGDINNLKVEAVYG